MSEAHKAPAPGYIAYKPLTFADHLANLYHLVIKELRSIRADPVMLILVVYAFSLSVYTVATGAKTEATNLSVGIVDEDGSALSRQIAEALTPPTFQPPVQIRAADIDPMMDPEQTPLCRRDPAELRGGHTRPAQDGLQINVDATAIAQAGNGSSSSEDRDQQRNPALHRRQEALAARRSTSSRARPSTRTSKRRGTRR